MPDWFSKNDNQSETTKGSLNSNVIAMEIFTDVSSASAVSGKNGDRNEMP